MLRLGLQAKLTISNPQDEYEQEADRAAAEVMRMTGPGPLSASAPLARMQGRCSDCSDTITRSQQRPGHEKGIEQGLSSGIDGEIADLKNGGSPLPHGVRTFFESRFGLDFGAVRIHTDARSAEASRALNAAAFTVGPDVVFSAGQYQPDSIEGRKLLAHELAHVVQQGHAGQLHPGESHPATERRIGSSSPQPSGSTLESIDNGNTGKAGGWCPAGAAQTAKGLNQHEQFNPVRGLGSSAAAIQRRFVAFGTLPDVNALLGLIGPPSGLNLNLNTAINQVQIASVLPGAPRSPALNTELTTIINHATQHAEVIVGRGQPEVEVGAFPQPSDMTVTRVQQIDIDDMLAIEAGARGNGVAAAAHEIQENFTAHAAAPVGGADRFLPAHQIAVQTESDIAEQLVGPGRHVAQTGVNTSPTTKTEVVDYDNYYLVFTATITAATRNVTISKARRAAPVNVSNRTIDQFGPGSAALPAGAAAVITAAVADVAANATSTVRIEGFSAEPAAGGGIFGSVVGVLGALTESQQRADAVLAAMRVAGVSAGRMNSVGRGPTNFVAANDTEPHRLQNRRVVITVRRPGP
jgi:outer membrane protein OmpA-like peptidoglycan-associated protein